MTDLSIIEKVSRRFDVSHEEAAEQIRFILDTCHDTAMQIGQVKLSGHEFSQKHLPPRRLYSRATKEILTIPGRTVVKYHRRKQG